MEEVVAQLHTLTAKMQQLEDLEKARQLSQNLAKSTATARIKANLSTQNAVPAA